MFLDFCLIFLCFQSVPCNANVIAYSKSNRGNQDHFNIESINEIEGKPLKSDKTVSHKDEPVASTSKIFSEMSLDSTTAQRSPGLSTTTEDPSAKRQRLLGQYRKLMEDLRECKKVKSQTTPTDAVQEGETKAEWYRRAELKIPPMPDYAMENRILREKDLDMMYARGGYIANLREKRKLCFKKRTNAEGRPDLNTKKKRKWQARNGHDFAHSPPPKVVLPRCCNCCRYSVLGCY